MTGDDFLWFFLAPVAVGAVFAVARATRAFAEWAIRRAVDQFTDAVQQKWNADIRAALEPIYDELSYNGGTSIKDMLRRVEQRLEALFTDK